MPARTDRTPAAELQKLLTEAAAFHTRGDLGAAERGYRAVLARSPDHFDALQLLGVVHAQSGRLEEAVELLTRAIRLKPESAEAHNNLGYTLGALARGPEAEASYRKAIALKADYYDARNNLGRLLLAAGRIDEAVDAYRAALALRPAAADAHNHLGNALTARGAADEAIACFRRAIELKPDHAEAHNNLGQALIAAKRGDGATEAIASFEAALAADPGHAYSLGLAALSAAYMCDWRRREELVRRVTAGVKAGQPVATPFVCFTLTGDPADQLSCATLFTRRHHPAVTPLWRGERYRHERIRIAYVSADLRDHAVAWLMAGLIEEHDRGQFEVYGISFGPEARGALRQRLEAGFEHFVDVRAQSESETAAFLRRAEIDIAVDLTGYTQFARPGIFAHRPAPVQVSYLGFPATMGAAFIDYLIADAWVIPEGERGHYAERIASLPDSFQVNDMRRKKPRPVPARRAAGLPEHGFVFCSFNNAYKLTPEFFDGWMRLLNRIEGSVLWLLTGENVTMGNLRREARARGVAPERLVFAPKVSAEDNLARLALADLYLDTLPVNAGTSAADALWAGVPLVTCTGRAFTGRVAGSLLRAVGLPELITESLDDYEVLAVKLATEPQLLRGLKERLAANRLTAPLFDIERFRRSIEAAYRTMWEMTQRGEPPRSFAVERMATGTSHGS